MMELIVKLNRGNCAFINVYWLKTVKKIKRFGSSEFFSASRCRNLLFELFDWGNYLYLGKMTDLSWLVGSGCEAKVVLSFTNFRPRKAKQRR